MTSPKQKIPQNKDLSELERVLIESRKEGMVAYVNSTPATFVELVELSLSDKLPFAWRAAFILTTVMKKNDKRISNRTDEMINAIDGKPDGHQRELLKILLKLEFIEEQESLLIDKCIDIWKDIEAKPALRFYALRMLMNITEKYPELESEIRLLTTDMYMDSLSQGIRSVIENRLSE